MRETLPLAGLSVVVTGEVPGLDRKAAQAAVEALGGRPVGSVSRSTGLVVYGDGAGVSKMAKVAQFAVPVLPAVDFAMLAADPAGWDGSPLGAPYEAPAIDGEAMVSGTVGEAPEDAVGPATIAGGRRSREHQLTLMVTYPGGRQDIHVACECGAKWQGHTIHMEGLCCPNDPLYVAPQVSSAGVALF